MLTSLCIINLKRLIKILPNTVQFVLKIACANCCMSLNYVISTIPEIVNAVTMSPYTISNLPIKFVIVPDIFIILL